MMISVLQFAIKYKVNSLDVQNAIYKYGQIDKKTNKMRLEYDEVELYNMVYRYMTWINRREEAQRDMLIKRTKRRAKDIDSLAKHNPNQSESDCETKRPED